MVKRLGYRLSELEPVQDAQQRLAQESRYLMLRLIVGAVLGMWTMLASLLIYVGALPNATIELVVAWVAGAFHYPSCSIPACRFTERGGARYWPDAPAWMYW
ncbi:hypothetical protein HAALTHF_43440n [Vreelandella aquamarina]|nr:hypothetical protein HAALTHF_43440n [Halomonas axialensis]